MTSRCFLFSDKAIPRRGNIRSNQHYPKKQKENKMHDENIRVPDDLYVSGFDDNHEFNNIITLTSVHVNTEHIGTHLANRIVYRLMHPEDDYEYTYIRSRTIYRESTND